MGWCFRHRYSSCSVTIYCGVTHTSPQSPPSSSSPSLFPLPPLFWWDSYPALHYLECSSLQPLPLTIYGQSRQLLSQNRLLLTRRSHWTYRKRRFFFKRERDEDDAHEGGTFGTREGRGGEGTKRLLGHDKRINLKIKINEVKCF